MQGDQERSPLLLLCRDDLKLGLTNRFVDLDLRGRQGGLIECAFGGAVLNADHPPLGCTEFSEPMLIALVGGEHLYAQTPGTHRHQRIVSYARLVRLVHDRTLAIMFAIQQGAICFCPGHMTMRKSSRRT